MTTLTPVPYVYDAKVIRVIDGDTVIFQLEKTVETDVDFGFYVKDKVSLKKTGTVDFRLWGINSPEITGATKVDGLKSKAELERLLTLGPIKVESFKTDKYGRWLADVYVKLPNSTEDLNTWLYVNDELMNKGFAAAYMR